MIGPKSTEAFEIFDGILGIPSDQGPAKEVAATVCLPVATEEDVADQA